MLTYQRTTLILGLICLLAAPRFARAAPAARRSPPRMSGPKDKPVPADSRFPGHNARPNGALLAPLTQPGLRLTSEAIAIRCRFGGGGCAVRHAYQIQNTGDATTLVLAVVSPRMAVLAEVDGKPALVDADLLPKNHGVGPPQARGWIQATARPTSCPDPSGTVTCVPTGSA